MPGERRRHRSFSGGAHHHHSGVRSSGRLRLGCSHRYRRLLKSERNLVAAMFSVASIVTASTALAEPDWFALKGGHCRLANNNSLRMLGVYQFFYGGHFEEKTGVAPEGIDGSSAGAAADGAASSAWNLIYHYGPQPNDQLKDCVDSRSLLVIRLIVAATFLSIICSLFAFALDIMGTTNSRLLKAVRRNGIFSILSLAFLVTVVALCYWCTALMSAVQSGGGNSGASHVVVSYGASFFIIVGSAAANVLAAASNLLQRWPEADRSSRDEQLRPFADDHSDDGWPSTLHLPSSHEIPTEQQPLPPSSSSGSSLPLHPPPYVP